MKKLTNQPPAVKLRRSTLDSIGFEPGEKTIVIRSRGIDRIGKIFLRHGLVEDPDQWWMKPVRFLCNGLLHEFQVTGCNGDFRVRLYQEKDAITQWIEKRPEAHSGRTANLSLELEGDLLKWAFKDSIRRGHDSFEDWLNAVLLEKRRAA